MAAIEPVAVSCPLCGIELQIELTLTLKPPTGPDAANAELGVNVTPIRTHADRHRADAELHEAYEREYDAEHHVKVVGHD
jgi:hypothetical protein